jgi:hypothetical protein
MALRRERGVDSAVQRGFDLRDVDFLHLHHHVHRPFRGGRVRALERGEERARHDLPAQTELVLAPAAVAFATAAVDDGAPVAVGLFLRIREDLERDRFESLGALFTLVTRLSGNVAA